MTLSATPETSIPRAPGLPLVGSLVDLSRDPAAFFVRCYRELGPVFRVRVPGRTMTVLAGPELARFMGSREGQAALRSRETWTPLAAEFGAERSLVSSDGPEHRTLRALMRRGYSREALKGRLDELLAVTDRCLERDWTPGGAVPVLRAMQRLVVSQLGTILTGHAPLDYVDDMRTTLDRSLAVHVVRQRPGIILRSPTYRRAKGRMLELGEHMMAHHRSRRHGDDEPRTLVDDLMEAADRSPELMGRAELTHAVLGPYSAGLHTVAGTTSTLIYLALRHPDVLVRIRAEADAVFSRPHLDDDVIDELPATQGAVQETLRLYPVAVAQPRTAAEDFTYAGHPIREGENVYCAVAVPHFLEEFFPDPLRFDLDRYSPERREHARPGAYSPFGRGPHTCLGKGIADVQMPLTVARLLHRLDLELDPPGYELRRRMTPAPAPSPSFRVRVTGVRTPSPGRMGS